LAHQVNDSGAQVGSPHYADAAMGPLLSSVQQLQINGGVDYFQTDPHLANFANFYVNLLTPREVRFGGPRKLISSGDGSTEGSELFGEMATGFAPSNPLLSARLMGAWNAEGKVQSGFFGSTILKISDQLPVASPQLGSATFPGWCSVLRYGYDTPNETALWVTNGTFYNDHRHQDNGSVILYALGAPLSIDWGSFYSPQTAGSYMHSAVIPESALKQPWNADVSLDTTPSPWRTASQEQFLDFDSSSSAVSSFQSQDGTTWKRTTTLMHSNENYPVIL